jgi:hypothetical protein
MLSAGNASRLGGGCKALTEVGGRTMLDWWRSIAGTVTVVCRSEHANLIDGPVVICDDGGGPALALSAALEHVEDRPLTVVYADTWVPAVPAVMEFCGVAAGEGGRKWDVIEDDIAAYCEVPEGSSALVAIGLYRFARLDDLFDAVGKVLFDAPPGEVGMADVVNAYGLPFIPVPGWQDVGDPAAQARWRLM